MPSILITPEAATDAFRVASQREVLPSSLSSREMREQLTRSLRESSVISARTNNAEYLQKVRKVVNLLVNGDIGLAEARTILRQTITIMGYTPEGGFPGSDPVPPAAAATLQDLSSERRVDLILKTQEALNRAAGQRARGMSGQRMRQFPAWELVRIGSRFEPRNWQRRWRQVGGKLYSGRMIALKGDPIWDRLGDSGEFDDAMDVDTPPFAFNSGMGWREVAQEVVRKLGVTGPEGESVDEVLDVLPKAKASAGGLDKDFVDKIKKDLEVTEDSEGLLTMKSIIERGQE